MVISILVRARGVLHYVKRVIIGTLTDYSWVLFHAFFVGCPHLCIVLSYSIPVGNSSGGFKASSPSRALFSRCSMRQCLGAPFGMLFHLLLLPGARTSASYYHALVLPTSRREGATWVENLDPRLCAGEERKSEHPAFPSN